MAENKGIEKVGNSLVKEENGNDTFRPGASTNDDLNLDNNTETLVY